ncbi:MAG: coiled-coil domain-containing protein [Cetobacterium sp.]
MKNLFFLGALVSTLLVSGCSSNEIKHQSVKSDIRSTKTTIYGAKDSTLRDYPLLTKDGRISSDRFNMDINFLDETIDLTFENISKDVIFLSWTDAKYIGFDGKEQRLFNLNQKDSGFYTKPIDSGVRPGEKIEVKLIPIENLKVLFGNSTTSQEILIDKPLFQNEKLLKNYAQMIIPINLNSKKGPIIQTNIYFGDGNKPKEVSTFLDTKPTKKIVHSTTKTGEELKSIKNENEKLNTEIQNKEEILKQLREKARLKAELEKKESEIAELMKKLNEN